MAGASVADHALQGHPDRVGGRGRREAYLQGVGPRPREAGERGQQALLGVLVHPVPDRAQRRVVLGRAQQPPGPPELLGGVCVGHREGFADGDLQGLRQRAGLGRFEQRPPAFGAAREQRADRVLLGAEVAVEGAQRDPGVPGDGLGGGAVGPVLGEERGRGAAMSSWVARLAALGERRLGRGDGLRYGLGSLRKRTPGAGSSAWIDFMAKRATRAYGGNIHTEPSPAPPASRKLDRDEREHRHRPLRRTPRAGHRRWLRHRAGHRAAPARRGWPRRRRGRQRGRPEGHRRKGGRHHRPPHHPPRRHSRRGLGARGRRRRGLRARRPGRAGQRGRHPALLAHPPDEPGRLRTRSSRST